LEAAATLADEGAQFDLILLDLGVSSPQIDNAERGFSFQQDAPLDMRMDQSQALTAAEVVNDYRLSELERVLRDLGEEPRWRAVAAAIIAARPLATTGELAKVVRTAAARTDRIDRATRAFQGIRIEVNAELEQLERALPLLEGLLAPDGRLAVISFHSLEDRIVKQYFDRQSHGCVCPPKQPICTCAHEATLAKLTRKPVTATADEIVLNPRARSAKLRAVVKIKQKGGT
jgi:16S rRNA (cytosine1402-N4)-methyltransferase